MTPTGYFRKLESLLALMRDGATCDLAMSDEGQAQEKALNTAADAVDQAWAELSHDDHVMVYNIALHITSNIKPASPEKKPESSLIQLN